MSIERTIWVYRDGVLVDKQLAPPLHEQFGQSAGIISDGMNATLNPANGRTYDSKSAYYKAVRAAGCEIIGNEKPSASAPSALPDPVHDIKAAFEQVESRSTTVRKRKRRG